MNQRLLALSSLPSGCPACIFFIECVAYFAMLNGSGTLATHCQGTIVKRYALAAIGLLFGGAVQAAVIDLNELGEAGNRVAGARIADVAMLHRNEVVAPPPAWIAELPEPEVFAMMVVGLVLIGYRASRDSSEKFE
jgi:hypothetical protein